ncbi:MAG: hypothetical protein GQ574_18570 [Crocinitomix sp.]|nr:hypothetical protein [Crocinitomix sp.]
MNYDIVILTQKKYVSPGETDWYTDQILKEDQLVQDALQKLNLKVTKKDWADPNFDWSSTKTILFRSTWDYFHRFNEFEPWLNKVTKLTQLINPAPQILWNMDKHYMQDLADKGVPIVDGHYIKRGSTQTLTSLHQKLGWTETVIKPTVSGSARHTYRLNPENYAEHETLFANLIQAEDFILQPFQKNIMTIGEVSHIVIHGNYSHSILKQAKEGDYRVQDDHGGTIHDYKANEAEIAFSQQAVAACDIMPLYARVDLIIDNNDQLALMELELIEPELWFRKNEKAADKLAAAIQEVYFG